MKIKMNAILTSGVIVQIRVMMMTAFGGVTAGCLHALAFMSMIHEYGKIRWCAWVNHLCPKKHAEILSGLAALLELAVIELETVL